MCTRASLCIDKKALYHEVKGLLVPIVSDVQALWVLGSAATLRRSPVWAALLEDAEKRTKIVPDAAARYANEVFVSKRIHACLSRGRCMLMMPSDEDLIWYTSLSIMRFLFHVAR